ncbi:four helix bundle protein [Dyadobacter bucti]|uniref:four helix bundle protein n=1 Tax=Dyadobacter bucti TaxID=2572203 RepID=UPI001107CEC6|nr:four helix bundle protein [Dyadobacter bucti]
MSKVEKFEDLKVWQDGLSLAVMMYESLAGCRDFSLKEQMCRSAVSISSNVAEGFERHSNKEFIRFLRIAKGSSGELRTQIYIAMSIGLIEREKGNSLVAKTQILSAMLQNLIKTRETKF